MGRASGIPPNAYIWQYLTLSLFAPATLAAKRAVLDEARMKARAAKAGLNPGPGAYDVKRPIETAAEVSLAT